MSVRNRKIDLLGAQVLKVRNYFHHRGVLGTVPGTMHENPDAEPTTISVFAYNQEQLVEQTIESPENLDEILDEWPTVWIQVSGLANTAAISSIGKKFGLHDLSLEDVVDSHQRPKVDEYPDYLFFVMRLAHFNNTFYTTQFSLFVCKDVIITFQEGKEDPFLSLRERIRLGRGRIRRMKTDYLAYSLMDAVVDSYYPVLEQFGESIEDMEESVLFNPTQHCVVAIRDIKRNLLRFRRAIWPLRDIVNFAMREHNVFIKEETRTFLRDCYDHTIQVIDFTETLRELASGLMDIYMSSVSNRMNQIMKVLTIFASIFIPLTFIAGIYGMNFNPGKSPWNMPELDWYLGYPYALMLMLAVAIGMLFFFRRKGWIGSFRQRPSSQREE